MASKAEYHFPPYPPPDLPSLDVSDLLNAIPLRESQADASINASPPSPQSQRLSKLPRHLVGISSKAYFSHAQTIAYAQKLLAFPPTDSATLRLFFIPSFPGVSTTSLLIQHAHATASAAPLNLLLGAQECHFAPAGAHTGSVPASELAELGCSLVELGHAERRRPPLAESDAMVAAKAKMAVAAGLVPLVCIGERTRPATAEEAMAEVRPQVESLLKAVGEEAHVILGYEPVWAIGQSDPAPAEYVCEVVEKIRKSVGQRKGDVRILYGGSAKPGIWKELRKSLDGLFLGRFAHNVDSLREILSEMAET